jgi:ribonucleotide reductase beta subunit family protein with ferritin-like domain
MLRVPAGHTLIRDTDDTSPTITDGKEGSDGPDHRYVLFPIQYHQIWKMYKSLESAFWCWSTIDHASDASMFTHLSELDQTGVCRLLAWTIIR